MKMNGTFPPQVFNALEMKYWLANEVAKEKNARMRFIVALHKTIDSLFCNRCPYNTLDSWHSIFDCFCPAVYFWELYERLHLWKEPYRKIKYMWPASVFGQKMSEGRRKDDEEMKEKKRFFS